ncbi:hypothetical protein BWZ20_13245 [Winogradskyella sp. J14-2]|uniref:DUF7619 domain-containing protein n=1 Tax=Winogradskyella sp. J14-2 TaxID=1936080 RepID=UPI000972BC67|nr:choice-of-anchor L domain-containing protein [Winogradskyella sp. J14-2]APY09208.1 hypothetical protein BWZ20_13245 [Winogradskyella sp. J14-2]
MKKLLLTVSFCFFLLNAFSQIANQPSDLVVCDDDNDGFAEFDLTILNAQIIGSQTNVIITYHETLADAESGVNAIPSLYTNISNPQTIFARVEGSTGNYDTTSFDLIVNPTPIAIQPTPLEFCDDNGDENTVFDLTVKDSEITGGNVTWAVTYYETLDDAVAQFNAIQNPTQYTNTFNPQAIYVVVTDTDTGCYSITTFDLIVNPTPFANQPNPLQLCDDDNDGFESFVLEDVLAQVLDNQIGVTASFHETLVDAESGINALLSPYTNTSNPQTIFVRLEDDVTGCYNTTSFDLILDTNCNTEEVITMQNGTFSACSGIFTDSGGLDENYSNDENYTITFCPDVDGDLIGLNFTYFTSQLSADSLSIYDGDSTNANLIGIFSGLNTPGEVIASEINASGCLTVTFISNVSGNTNGWMADVNCFQSCQDITPSIDSTVPEANENGVIIASNIEEVTFSAGATFSDNGTGAIFNWDFGDGNTATGESAMHTFTVPGTYDVTLTVQDNNPIGCEESMIIPVEILDNIVSINNANDPESYLSLEELIFNVFTSEDASVNIFSSQVNGNPTDLETKNYGYFNREGAQNFPFEEGIVLSTGVAYQGGNTTVTSLVSNDIGQPGDIDLENALNITNTNDAAFIKFNFIPRGDQISFRYLLASEEYDGSSECFFSDSFAFLLREVGTTEYTNLAVLPDGTPVNVTNVNNAQNCASNTEYFEGYSIGDTNYNGRTAVLTASASVIPNTEYEIKLVVADQSDSIWDTAIFLEGDSFNLGNIGLINVSAFNDFNNNGTIDIDETAFTNGSFTYEKNNDGIVSVVNTSTGSFTIASTDENDIYNISFLVNEDSSSCYTQSLSSIEDVGVLFGEVANIDFPVVDNLACEDLAVYLVNPFAPPRPGFEHTNLLIIENLLGGDIANGSIEFTLDENLEINSTTLSNPNMSITTTASGFTLDFVDFTAGSSETVEITLQTPVTVALDEIVTNSASYITDTNDTVANNNTSTLTEVVVGSYDPNDKMEAHGPEIVYDEFVTSDQWLYYTIRFQNLGTAEAIFVRIEDELNAQLDESTFQMLRSSHDYVITRTGKDLEWYFDNINLPAEQDDAAGSIGFVYFRIRPQPGYALGDIIPNTAAIYFDFNAPVITNTFNTTFVEPLSINDFEGVEISVFPNPAKDKVKVTLSQNVLNSTTVSLVDIQGKMINIPNKEFNNTVELDVSTLNSGLYFIQLRSGNNTITEKLIVE